MKTTAMQMLTHVCIWPLQLHNDVHENGSMALLCPQSCVRALARVQMDRWSLAMSVLCWLDGKVGQCALLLFTLRNCHCKMSFISLHSGCSPNVCSQISALTLGFFSWNNLVRIPQPIEYQVQRWPMKLSLPHYSTLRVALHFLRNTRASGSIVLMTTTKRSLPLGTR